MVQRPSTLSISRVVAQTFRHHWRILISVLLGVTLATAVLTGALLVGDSMRDSLRHLALDRLGDIDQAVIGQNFFRAALVEEMAKDDANAQVYSAVVPTILLSAISAERGTGPSTPAQPTRAAGVTLIGSTPAFWELGPASSRPKELPSDREVVLNRTLADALHAQVGDSIVLRLPVGDQVPADSPLAQKSNRIRSLAQLRVIAIVPASGLGRFDLTNQQQPPRLAYVSLATLQRALGQDHKINTILLAQRSSLQAESLTPSSSQRDASPILRPNLEDFGVSVTRHQLLFPDAPSPTPERVFDYLQIATDRMMWDPRVAQALHVALKPLGAQEVLTYLANSIERVDQGDGRSPPRAIPYSMVSALDSHHDLGPLDDVKGQVIASLADDEIALNQWTADRLAVRLGDIIRLRYFLPETTHGDVREAAAEFRVSAIIPLTEPARPFGTKQSAAFDQRPTRANDPHLTPTVVGVTDEASIEDWDPPFPYDPSRITKEDEVYWDFHRTTPKAFVSLAAGRRLWNSRFGGTTSFRVPHGDKITRDSVVATVTAALWGVKNDLGFAVLPLRSDALRAARGTTDFQYLFLGFSGFLMIAALLLVALLFRLGIERRASELGILSAVGWKPARIRGLLLAEALPLALFGGILGAAAGAGYAALMIAGLRSPQWWLAAVSTPFLRFHASLTSLVIGASCGALIGWGVTFLSTRPLRHASVRRLLSNQLQTAASAVGDGAWHGLRWVPMLLLVVAVILGLLGARWDGEGQAGAFFTSGAALLAAQCLALYQRWRYAPGRSLQPASMGLLQLAGRNAGRNAGRSTLTTGLMAAACFIIIAMSAFRVAPTLRGTGGFDFIAESGQPIFADLTTPTGRQAALGENAHVLDGAVILPLRRQAGDDASCRNLFRSQRPALLGVTEEVLRDADRTDVPHFAWAAGMGMEGTTLQNPWRLLHADDASPAGVIPVILDKNTALYALKLSGRIGETFDVEYGPEKRLTFRVVALLSGSVLQGSLMVAERDLLSQFPNLAGQQVFLIRAPAGRGPEIARQLETTFADQGLQVELAADRLDQLLAVQNTYLSTFQSLGALGLVLGAIGVALVQLRGVEERRSELALLQAAGFRRARIAQLVLAENMTLLGLGLGMGVLAALVAVLPHHQLTGSSLSITSLAGMLMAIIVTGLVSATLSVRAVLRSPIVSALRHPG